jgi:hypothetical protein
MNTAPSPPAPLTAADLPSVPTAALPTPPSQQQGTRTGVAAGGLPSPPPSSEGRGEPRPAPVHQPGFDRIFGSAARVLAKTLDGTTALLEAQSGAARQAALGALVTDLATDADARRLASKSLGKAAAAKALLAPVVRDAASGVYGEDAAAAAAGVQAIGTQAKSLLAKSLLAAALNPAPQDVVSATSMRSPATAERSGGNGSAAPSGEADDDFDESILDAALASEASAPRYFGEAPLPTPARGAPPTAPPDFEVVD